METGTFPRLMTVRDIAGVLGLQPQQIYRLLEKGVMRDCLVRIGNSRTLRFNREKVRACIENGGFKLSATDETAVAHGHKESGRVTAPPAVGGPQAYEEKEVVTVGRMR
jgi:excisionase family DNA binding protein